MIEDNNKLRKKAVLVARNIIEDKIHILEGIKELNDIRFNLNSEDEAFNIFRSIDSDLLHIPIGKAREHWDSKNLAKMDEEVEQYIKDIKIEIKESCKQIIEKFGT